MIEIGTGCESAVGFGADQRDKMLKSRVTHGSRAGADSQMKALREEGKSLRAISAELAAQGHRVSHVAVKAALARGVGQ